MSISIRNPKVEILAKEIALKMNVSMTQAILTALEEKQSALGMKSQSDSFSAQMIKKISEECSSLPDLDSRDADEILGYDRNGGFSWS